MLLNEKGEEVEEVVVGAGGKPLIGVLNPDTDALVAGADADCALGALDAGIIDGPAADEPFLGPKKLGAFKLPDEAGDAEASFEGSG